MKVLSLFDGMSCGQIALKRLGIRTETYYASEIDRHAYPANPTEFSGHDTTRRCHTSGRAPTGADRPADRRKPLPVVFLCRETSRDVHHRQGGNLYVEALFGIEA